MGEANRRKRNWQEASKAREGETVVDMETIIVEPPSVHEFTRMLVDIGKARLRTRDTRTAEGVLRDIRCYAGASGALRIVGEVAGQVREIVVPVKEWRFTAPDEAAETVTPVPSVPEAHVGFMLLQPGSGMGPVALTMPVNAFTEQMAKFDKGISEKYAATDPDNPMTSVEGLARLRMSLFDDIRRAVATQETGEIGRSAVPLLWCAMHAPGKAAQMSAAVSDSLLKHSRAAVVMVLDQRQRVSTIVGPDFDVGDLPVLTSALPLSGMSASIEIPRDPRPSEN